MVEKQNVEWKTIWKDEYLAWLCGFANAQGGKLYIGMNDNGIPVGLLNSKKLLEDLPNKIRDTLGIIANINLHDMNGNDYIEIEIPPYPIAISCKGLYYYRSGSTNQRLVGAELENFLLKRRGLNWENIPIPQLTLDDIDDGIIENFIERATKIGRIDSSVLSESKEHLIEKLHLKNEGFLTNAAALLFCKDPEQWIAGAYVKVGFFETDAELIYQDEVRGSLLEIVDKIIELVYYKYLKAKISYSGMQRIERYPYPEAALREALLNAVTHKLYGSRIPIQISIYDDKLYIANCGQLPETWTIENLMEKHVSKPFNPDIAHVLYLAGFIESWGRGIEKICEACQRDDIPQPEYTVHPGDIMIKFTAPADRVIFSGKRVVIDEVHEPVYDRVYDRVRGKISIGECQVLGLLLEDPSYTFQEMADKLSVSRKTVGVRIKSLKEKKVIQRIGSEKKGYWNMIES